MKLIKVSFGCNFFAWEIKNVLNFDTNSNKYMA